MIKASDGRTLAAFLVSFALLAAPAAATQAPAPAVETQPARQLFVVHYRPGTAWVAGRPMHEQNLRPHGLYYRDLLRQGRVVAGGGFVGEDGGLAILRAADRAEAEAMLAADPAIRDGIFAAELRQWAPRFGGVGPLVEPSR